MADETDGETLILKSQLFEVMFIKPCETDKGKKMAEIQLKIPKPWDLDELCASLRDNFLDVKCSQELGTAKAAYAGKTLIFNLEGKVTVQKAENEEDVAKTAVYLADIFGLNE